MDVEIGTNSSVEQQQPLPAGVQGTKPTQPQGVPAVPDSQDQGGQPSQSDPELDDDGNPIQPAPELDEWEDEDGKKHRVPKALVPRLMKDADYTRKTQELAEAARQREQQFAQAQQQLAYQAQVHQAHRQQFAQLAALDAQLAQYGQVNWQQATQADPTAAQAAWMQMQQLKEQRTGVAGQLQAMEQQHAAQVQQGHQQAVQQAQAVVERIVSSWTPEDRAAVNEVGAKVYGVSQAHFQFFAQNPGLLPILRDAVKFQQAMTRATSAAKPAAGSPALAPSLSLPQGSGQATPRGLDSPGISAEAWMERRNEQLRKRRK